MTTRGDLILYRGIEPVPGKFLKYTDTDGVWKVVVQLSRAVASIYRVEIDHTAASDVEFYGGRVVAFIIPETLRRSGESLTGFLQNSTIRIFADARLRELGTTPDTPQTVSVSVGMGAAPVLESSLEEAVQRCIRFLLMGKDPLRPDRGGQLLQMRRRGLLTEAVAHRMVETACHSWNTYPRRVRAVSRWTVQHTKPFRVRYLTWSQVEDAWGLVPLGDTDLVGRSLTASQSDERVLAVTLKMQVVQGDDVVELASAVTI